MRRKSRARGYTHVYRRRDLWGGVGLDKRWRACGRGMGDALAVATLRGAFCARRAAITVIACLCAGNTTCYDASLGCYALSSGFTNVGCAAGGTRVGAKCLFACHCVLGAAFPIRIAVCVYRAAVGRTLEIAVSREYI